jgi:phospholipid-translocating ATPase
MSADYAFGQFRFLTRLLLVHGRWSYVRVADMHANFFYKNVIWTLAMFWFLIFSSFDATYLFEYTFVLLYNLIFTSLPVGILGAFDQDTNAVCSMAFPQLYKRGIKGLDYTRLRFWLYMLDGLYQSAVIFFIPYFIYGDGTTWSSSGRDTNDLYDLSSAIAASGVFAANLYVGINTRYWTFIPWIIIPLSTLAVFIWIAIYSYMANLAYYAVVSIIFPTFHFWATVVFTVMVAVAPHWLLRAIKQSYFPIDKDIIREAWVGGDLKDQLGVPHRKRRRRVHPDIEASFAYKPRPPAVDTRLESPIRPSDPLLSQRAPNSDSVGPSTPTSPTPRPDPSWPQAWPQAEPYTQSWPDAERWRDTPGGSTERLSPATRSPVERQPTERLSPLSQRPQAQARRQPPSAWGNPDFTEDTAWQNRPPSEFDENYAGRAV